MQQKKLEQQQKRNTVRVREAIERTTVERQQKEPERGSRKN
jgi:hypothetical protein